jgi:hypothetical protein
MAIEKKSLINTLKTTKKAKAASKEVDASPSNVTSKTLVHAKRGGVLSKRGMSVSSRRAFKG